MVSLFTSAWTQHNSLLNICQGQLQYSVRQPLESCFDMESVTNPMLLKVLLVWMTLRLKCLGPDQKWIDYGGIRYQVKIKNQDQDQDQEWGSAAEFYYASHDLY